MSSRMAGWLIHPEQGLSLSKHRLRTRHEPIVSFVRLMGNRVWQEKRGRTPHQKTRCPCNRDFIASQL
ncbi:protein of unknown function [Nitrospira japonica]|uniref:Uncharacterized protein n=1 Tax=Nitrospira japonica TaxID=1325564 RepID=A0A1W1I840_9BACT|nr:protein of unknown function [Nitrospira japonica]